MSQRESLGFLTKTFSKSSEIYYLQPGLYPSAKNIFEAMKTPIQERQNHSESCIRVKMSQRTQKVEIYLVNDRFGLTFFSADLGHIFSTNIGNETGEMLRVKKPHKPKFADDIVLIHSLMIYKDLVENTILGDKKVPLLRCLPFISKLKSGEIITTGQYMNSQTFSNLQIRPLMKISCHSTYIDLRDASG